MLNDKDPFDELTEISDVELLLGFIVFFAIVMLIVMLLCGK